MQIAFDQRVLDYIAPELNKSPDTEEGGKYVGYLFPESHPQLEPLGLDPRRLAMIVTDFLPSGPNAIRTAVELQPDGEYQEALFRRLEVVDSAVEHLGTWHSHHCNGLQTLSSGDISGYLRTVNRREYRPECFLASLVKCIPRDVGDQGWIDHFLFVKGADKYYSVTDSVTSIRFGSTFAISPAISPSHSWLPVVRATRPLRYTITMSSGTKRAKGGRRSPRTNAISRNDAEET